jgi:hypothetical protein
MLILYLNFKNLTIFFISFRNGFNQDFRKDCTRPAYSYWWHADYIKRLQKLARCNQAT